FVIECLKKAWRLTMQRGNLKMKVILGENKKAQHCGKTVYKSAEKAPGHRGDRAQKRRDQSRRSG
ncbi:hypothetical protein QUG62_10450, partial [Klebsiella michiganensis]|uniref:hypothetical protein n=1 Tax=Klebsiella michiganensis TaxID=1134687 RepID=UPI0025A1D5E8